MIGGSNCERANRRLANWPARYRAFLQQAAQAPFQWSVWDCCVFAAGGVHALTGVDVLAPWRRSYSDAESALRAVRRFGGRDGLAGCGRRMAERHGWPLIVPEQASRGDVILASIAGQNLFGLVDLGGDKIVAVTQIGLSRFSMDMAVMAWRI